MRDGRISNPFAAACLAAILTACSGGGPSKALDSIRAGDMEFSQRFLAMEGDVEAKADYAKMEKVCRLVYRVAMDIGDKPALLKLDLRPEVTVRGPENMKVEWR